MSLQIWLPLNTNTIKNQGLNNTTFSINGNWFNQGKIGNTSFTNGTITIPKETAKDILNNQELTISFWIYINQEEGSQTGASICFGNNLMGENNNRKFSLFVYPTVNDLHWSWMNDAANTTFPTGASVLDDCLSSYKWTHVTVTYNNPNAKIYINGELKHSFTGVSNSSSFEYDTTIVTASNYFAIQDFRLYNHCLSQKEIDAISQGLILHYPLKGSFNTEYDNSGYGNDGTIKGAINYSEGSIRYKKCLFIDNGYTNYIESNSFFAPKDEITMSCWVKGTAGVAGYGDYHIPLSAGSHYEFSLEGTTGKFKQGFHINGVRNVTTTSKEVLDGNWHLLSATYDGQNIRRYVDAELVSEVAATGTLSGGSRKFTIGNFQSGNYGNKNLFMSDVRIYATALTAADIKELYEVSASIDKNGNFFGYDFIQENSETITKPGIISTDDYFEVIKYDNAYWIQLLHHNSHNGTVMFTAENNGYCDQPDLYSRLNWIDYFKMNDGYYEFLVLQPDQLEGNVNRWRQLHSPNDSPNANHTITIIEGMTGSNSYGIQSGPISNAKFSHGGQTNDWWNALGCLKAHQGGIPGFSRQIVKGSLDFYARLDDTNLSIFQNFIKQSQIIEI